MGALVACWAELSSGVLKEIMSPKLTTSFLIVSGKTEGIAFPFRASEHRYIARANSGNKSEPDLLVSARLQISLKTCGGRPESMRISLAALPERACPSPVSFDLKSCSKFCWSSFVINDKRTGKKKNC